MPLFRRRRLNRARRDLWSTDEDEVLEALFALSADRKTPPPLEIVERCAWLMLNHSDVDVRHQAVRYVGIMWADCSAYEAVRAACEDTEEFVAVAAVSALTRFASKHRNDIGRRLAQIVQTRASTEMRGAAYIGLLELDGRVSAAQRARLPDDIEQLDVDLELVRRWSANRPSD